MTFDDLPSIKLKEMDVLVEPYGTAHLIIVDAIKADKTTHHHGIRMACKQSPCGNA